MARDGSGTYNRTQNDYVFGEIISETEVNSELNDIAAALTQSLSKDGQTVPTANLPMGNFKLTGLANGSARTDSAAIGQIQDSSFMWGGTAGGTSDALTITPSPAITAYAAGQAWRLINQGTANTTTTPTIAISGLANRTIKRRDGSAIAPGDLAASAILDLVDDGTALRLVNFTGGSLVKAINTARSTVASAATTADIWGAANQIDWTGTTTCTGFPAAPQAGSERVLICAAAAPFTAGVNMKIDGVTSGDTITCAANDIMIVRAETTTQFRLSRSKYVKPDGPTVQIFTSSGTYTKPAGLAVAIVEVCGGGGGGGGAVSAADPYTWAGGGGGGSVTRRRLLASAIGATETVTVGAGGAGGNTSGTVGAAGGTSSFGTLVDAPGGSGGGGAAATTTSYVGGAGGSTGSAGDVFFRGDSGGDSVGAATSNASFSGRGGGCQFGGGGLAQNLAGTDGNAGLQYGGGGSGASGAGSGQTGGAGFKGVVIVTEYY